MNDDDKSQPLTRDEFQGFLENHFWHLHSDVIRIKGILYVLVPLMMAILAIVVSLAIG